jgi:tetratricopeptide (TPR) repeat protein
MTGAGDPSVLRTNAVDILKAVAEPSSGEFYSSILEGLVSSPHGDYEETLVDLLATGELATANARLGASWALLTIARRRKDPERFRSYLDMYLGQASEFRDSPLRYLMLAESAVAGEDDPDEATLRTALDQARRAIDGFVVDGRSVAGFRCRPTLMTIIGILLDLINRDPEDKGDLLRDAERYVEAAKAIDPSEYPKLLAWEARVLLERGKLPEARAAIRKAIAKERSDRFDYAIAIGDYTAIKLQIQIEEEKKKLEEQNAKLEEANRKLRDETDKVAAQQARIDKELTDSRGEILTLMGLLAAVIALIVSVANPPAHMSARAAMLVSVVTAGAIILVFTAYQFLFPRRGPAWRYAITLVFGVALTAIPFFVSTK